MLRIAIVALPLAVAGCMGETGYSPTYSTAGYRPMPPIQLQNTAPQMSSWPMMGQRTQPAPRNVSCYEVGSYVNCNAY